MIEIIHDNIEKPKTEVVVIPSDCILSMKSDVAKTLINFSSDRLYKETRKLYLKEKNNLDIGDCFFTEPFRLKRRGVKTICHALLSKYPNSGFTLNEVNSCIKNIMNKTINKYDSIAFTGLGCGYGKINKKLIASNMYRILNAYSDNIVIKIIDLDEEFINEFLELEMKEEKNEYIEQSNPYVK